MQGQIDAILADKSAPHIAKELLEDTGRVQLAAPSGGPLRPHGDFNAAGLRMDMFRDLEGDFVDNLLQCASVQDGGVFNPGELRNYDAQPHESWQQLDQALIQEGRERLAVVRSLTPYPLDDAFGTTEVRTQSVDDTRATPAVGMTGEERSEVMQPDFKSDITPVPVISRDLRFNRRVVQGAAQGGVQIDRLSIQNIIAHLMDFMEQITIYGVDGNFDGNTITGLWNTAGVNTSTTMSNWLVASTTGPTILSEFLSSLEILRKNRFYGPYRMYVTGALNNKLDEDYSTSYESGSIRERLLRTEDLVSIEVSDQLKEKNCVIMEDSGRVAQWISGVDPTTVSWSSGSGFTVNYKVFVIGAPMIRTTYSGRSGILALTIKS
ncbi:MAG: DUF6260 family protein [Acidobacteria bacterium]|nr:DUF6260 family protein [Acidobacteriota bacterium]